MVRRLFREYAAALDIDLRFQDFESEVAELPGRYAPPAGRILLAWDGGKVLGCVAMRRLDATHCEMKRLYVRPAGRGLGIGRRLATMVCATARAAGYDRVRLDTLPAMHAAHDLYASMGFRAVIPYVFNPIDGAQFLELHLSDSSE